MFKLNAIIFSLLFLVCVGLLNSAILAPLGTTFELSGTYIIFIVLFLVFLFLLNKTVLEPVGKAMELRKARSLDDYQQARAYAGEGEAVVTRYQNRIHEVRSEAQKTVQDAVASAQKQRDKKLKEVQADGNTKVERI